VQHRGGGVDPSARDRHRGTTAKWRTACDDIFEKPLLARVTGLEPATSGVTGRRSNQLSYTRSGEGERLGCVSHIVKGLPAEGRKRNCGRAKPPAFATLNHQ
jgi:hypothetical protein